MIKALSNILHNGTLYQLGDVVDLGSEAEAKLISSGVAVLASEAKPTPKVVKEVKVSTENPSTEWTKTRLLGYARGLGIAADETMNKKDIMTLIETAPIAPPVADGDVPAVTINENFSEPELPEIKPLTQE